MAPFPTPSGSKGKTPPGPTRDLYAITLDTRLAIIRIDDLGVQRVEDVTDYLAVLTSTVAEARRRSGKVRVLADLRRSPVRTQEAAERIRVGNQSLYRSGDRVALLVASSLLTMQLRRNLVAQYQRIFTSQQDAETWLMADDDV